MTRYSCVCTCVCMYVCVNIRSSIYSYVHTHVNTHNLKFAHNFHKPSYMYYLCVYISCVYIHIYARSCSIKQFKQNTFIRAHKRIHTHIQKNTFQKLIDQTSTYFAAYKKQNKNARRPHISTTCRGRSLTGSPGFPGSP
jgi:hypothetical protein